MRISDRRVCAQLAELARGDETPSQLVRRLLAEREELRGEVRTLRRQLRYKCAQVKKEREQREAEKQAPKHLTEAQARGIEQARREYFGYNS